MDQRDVLWSQVLPCDSASFQDSVQSMRSCKKEQCLCDKNGILPVIFKTTKCPIYVKKKCNSDMKTLFPHNNGPLEQCGGVCKQTCILLERLKCVWLSSVPAQNRCMTGDEGLLKSQNKPGFVIVLLHTDEHKQWQVVAYKIHMEIKSCIYWVRSKGESMYCNCKF